MLDLEGEAITRGPKVLMVHSCAGGPWEQVSCDHLCTPCVCHGPPPVQPVAPPPLPTHPPVPPHPPPPVHLPCPPPLSHIQIGRKLENNLNKLLKKAHSAGSTSDHCTDIAPLKETTTHLSMFPNKDTPCSRENECTRKGHVTFRMLSIKKRLLSRLFCTKY